MDWWKIVAYVVGVIFNVAAVSVARTKALEAGKKFLGSGTFAIAAVYVLCITEQLVAGHFDALSNSAAFVALLQQAWLMTGAAMGTHTVAKRLK